ncbi:CD209 antigen-like protein E isoform X1 [Esox lucius]|uniref:CD209 antigen-like protein E isoform X1 n=1 Tax=Esox lucius TaxID=8010 RepID=UPI0014773490|nr:CD209 antigen-like protein E isoform X1 [Esox lucius]
MSERVYEPMSSIRHEENTPDDMKTMDIDKNVYASLNHMKPSKNSDVSAQHSVWRKRFRAAVCLGLLSVVLLAGSLCLLLYQRDQLEVNYKNLIKEKLQLQTNYVNLTKDRDKLRSENEHLKLSSALKGCQPGWLSLGSRCYYVSAELKTWDRSKQDCLERGANLVTIKSPEEQRERSTGQVLTMMSLLQPQKFVNWMCGVKNYVWIGLTDLATEGNWKWVDGTPLTAVYWNEGEPDGGEAENCGYFYSWSSDSGEWWDSSCSDTHRWICQK